MNTENSHTYQNKIKPISSEKRSVSFLSKYLAATLYQIKNLFIFHIWLITLGVVSECFYLLYLVNKFPIWSYYQDLTDMGIINNYSLAGFVTFMLIFSLLFGLVLLAWRETHLHQDKATFYLISGFAATFASTAIFVYPINAIDIFGYIAQSRVLILYHANPMITAPVLYTKDPLIQLLSSFVANPPAYGPFGILITAIPTLFVGSHLLANLLLLKGFSALFLLGSTYLIYRIAAHIKPEIAISSTLIFAWNPYVQLEYIVNSHNDIIMIFFLLLGIFASINNRHVAAFAFILLSSLIKYATLSILPLFFINAIFYHKIIKEKLIYVLYVCIVTIIILSTFVLPFWVGPQTFTSFFDQVQVYLYSFSMFLNNFSPLSISLDQSKVIGLWIFTGCYLYALWHAFRSRIGLIMGCFLVMLTFLAFAVTYIQPWYIIWACIPALLVPQKRIQQLALLLAYGATMIELVHPYIWPWGAYQNANAFAIANSVTYLILFGPALFLLVGYGINETIKKLKRSVISEYESQD